MKKMMEKLDEVLLLDAGFKYGVFSNTTLWGTDRNGLDWVAILDQPGEIILWSSVRANGGLNPRVTMTRQQFGELFNGRKDQTNTG